MGKLEAALEHVDCRLDLTRRQDLQVETAAENPVVSGDHDGAGVVAVGVVERVVEGLLHRRAEDVDFAVVHRDERDGIIEAITDRTVAHGVD